ncbi:CaiB/BaiF CoA transferase family protein [Cryptosporangium aurantiacum]|uniref:Crotonobetainyl-CoA:carnitine CoA-transferase CaiB n=1 Tax=Cryptosporangium aurantiacum TaxID=134849 RepID=A0A1M7R4G3_9ACTN|nr:CoA transferase [Cryptosporangium aurantiacum]SHN40127.1 Crotonobetainyl-CoA:carnitine CoA-transferase CaiB [Cryptosporangium aurantiacum]
MTKVFEGIRVLELATWGYIPSAGVALADWGAEVIKIEHPAHGDPMRGLVLSGLAGADVDFMFQLMSRGKRSVGLDLTRPEAREVLLALAATVDVFLTNYLPPVRRKLGVDVDDLRAANPRLIYAKGSGLGPQGAEADVGGFDFASYWARGGLAFVSDTGLENGPPPMPGGAFGDLQAGLYTAGGVAGALFHRERTGQAPVVDTSLLGAAVWATAPHIAASGLYGIDAAPRPQHDRPPNVLSNTYATADGRHVTLVMLESDRFWAPLMEVVGRRDLADDPRFADAAARRENNTACVRELEAIFAARPLDEWRDVLSRQRGVWSVVQSPREVAADPQVRANGYTRTLPLDGGRTVDVVTPPIQFDGARPDPVPAPALGADTELVLLESGLDWDRIAALKEAGAIT